MEKEIKNKKLAMIVAAGKALDYQKKNPNAEIEDVMKHIMKEARVSRDARISAIAAVSHALNYKQKKPRATEKEIMQNLANSSDEILNSIKNQ